MVPGHRIPNICRVIAGPIKIGIGAGEEPPARLQGHGTVGVAVGVVVAIGRRKLLALVHSERVPCRAALHTQLLQAELLDLTADLELLVV
uniref:Uncharacterized protein n=1 Tax=Anopheles atroparvus TaxID=41427 RepID=A0AAG5DAU7_ANOAO